MAKKKLVSQKTNILLVWDLNGNFDPISFYLTNEVP